MKEGGEGPRRMVRKRERDKESEKEVRGERDEGIRR